jgi:hypothetical protein
MNDLPEIKEKPLQEQDIFITEDEQICEENNLSEKVLANSTIGSILDEIDTISDKDKPERHTNSRAFPVNVFPMKIQKLINSSKETLHYDPGYYAASIMFATSVAIGNSHRIRIKGEWVDAPILYFVLVGDSGVGKTHPMKAAIEPLKLLETAEYERYKDRKKKEEEENKNFPGNSKSPGSPSTVFRQHIMNDHTLEALTEAHSVNLRGLGLYMPEITAWIDNLNRYRGKGADEQTWLSIHSGEMIKVNRKGKDPLFINDPCISVLGGIQTNILKTLSADNRGVNGFINRLLFVFPEDTTFQPFNESEIPGRMITDYKQMIYQLMGYPLEFYNSSDDQPTTTINPIILDFTPESKKLFVDWFNHNQELKNKANDTSIQGIYAKLDTCVGRIALILQMMHHACDKDQRDFIGTKAMEGAIKVIEYFRIMALNAFNIISSTPVNESPFRFVAKELRRKFPDISNREIASRLGISHTSVNDFLKRV